MTKSFYLFVLFFLLLGATIGCSSRKMPPPEGSSPQFSATDMRGRSVSLSQFKGKPVLISFWASWCSFCVRELPTLEKLWKRYQRDGLVVMGVSVDQDQREALLTARTSGVTFPMLFDTYGEAARAYNVTGVPMTVLLNSSGALQPILDPSTGTLVPALYGPRNWLAPSLLQFMNSRLRRE